MRSPTDPRPLAPDFGRVSGEHAQIFIGIMGTLHSEPTASAFGRLLNKRLGVEDYILLVHVFEEISVVILVQLIPAEPPGGLSDQPPETGPSAPEPAPEAPTLQRRS